MSSADIAAPLRRSRTPLKASRVLSSRKLGQRIMFEILGRLYDWMSASNLPTDEIRVVIELPNAHERSRMENYIRRELPSLLTLTPPLGTRGDFRINGVTLVLRTHQRLLNLNPEREANR